MAEPALSHDDYTVAWICPIEVEQIPAILMLDTEHDPLPQSPNDHNVYTLGSIKGHNIVVASLPTAGNCPAATVMTQMRNTFRNLRFCLLVGIGGGVPTTTDQGPIRLGHVVVSQPSGRESGVVQYDHGKMEADGHTRRTGVLAPPPSVLLNAAQQMSVRRRIARQDPLIKHLQRVDTSPEMLPEYKYPGKEKDPLYDRETQGIRNTRYETMDDDGCPKWIAVHRGTIGTGEKVLKNAEARDKLSKSFGAICFEMEAAGALADFPCLVIRGVSDYADQSKNDDWQPYAAASAAAYARELFFHMPVDQVKECSIPEKDLKKMIHDTSHLRQNVQDKDVKAWLSPPDPSTNQNSAKEKHLDGTGQWFIESGEFLTWKANPNSTLWLHGIPGCGKTIISSTAIQHLHHTAETKRLIYFFFDFSDTSKQSFEYMVRSFIFQLAGLEGDAKEELDNLYKDCRDGDDQPDLKSLCGTFDQISNKLRDLTIVLDALDECERRSRQSLMDWLGTLECRILMTSRKLEDIQSSIEGWARTVAIFSFQEGPVNEDIRTYVRKKLGRGAMHKVSEKSKLARKWIDHQELLDKVEEQLTKRAGGMFRWAACQLDALEEYEMPYDLLQALGSLPETLDETYRRILDDIPRKHLSNSVRILQFLTYARRPIKIKEAVDILATTPEGNPKFDVRNRMPDSKGILKFCSSLVTISEDEEQIQLAHFSVKEYLASPQTKGCFDLELQQPRAEESIINVLFGYMSLLTNCHLWQENKHAMLRYYPLAEYGAMFWVEHAKRTGENSSTQELILEFFGHKEALFITTSLILKPEHNGYLSWLVGGDGKACSPLYLAAMNGWKHVVEGILSQDPTSIDEVGCGYRGSALRVACHHHHVDVVKILLEKGADVNPVARSPYPMSIFGYETVTSTILMKAFIEGHNDLVELLLEYDADPNIQVTYPRDDIFPPGVMESSLDYTVDTYPLIRASLWGFEDLTRILLHKGALPNKTDDFGNTALYYACWAGHYRIANLLLSHGANIDGANDLYATPFHAACESGYDEVIRLLLERSQTRSSKFLGEALQTASFWGQLDTADLLLSYGADPNQTGGDYGPALHAASSRGHLRVVELLLNRGADPHVPDCHQWNALFLAIKNGYDDVSQALWKVSGGGPLSQCFCPSTFLQLDKYQEIEITISERTVEGVSYGGGYYNAVSDHPFVATTRHIYFQIKVLSTWQRELLASNQPEFGPSSYGFVQYPRDSFGPGRNLDGESANWLWFPSLEENDNIGCGVDYDSNTSFFTLNGKLYGTLMR